MSLTLSSVARIVGGTLRAAALTEHTRIDGLSPLDEYVVVGNAEYATIVTGTVAQLRRRLTTDTPAQLRELTGAVFVTHADTPALRELLHRFAMPAIIGTSLGGSVLHAVLGSMIDRDQAAADRLVTSGMKILTQVARRGGVSAVVVQLARQIDGWVVLLDTQGQMIASAGAGRLHIGDAAAVALGKPVRVRHPGLQTHQVGSDTDLVGYLVISSRANWMRHTRDLAQQAAGLCDLLLRSHNPSVTESLGREALMDRLLAGGSAASQLLRRWGVHDAELSGFALAARSKSIDLDRVCGRWLDDLGAEHVFAHEGNELYGFVRPELTAALAERTAAFAPVGGVGLHLGIGRPVTVDDLSTTLTHAREALRTSLDTGVSVTEYAELPSIERVISRLPPEVNTQLARLLDPLRNEHGNHTALTETLRAFLAENGGHRAAAQRLGIHRQTLATRITRIEDSTGLRLHHADDRATAWLALRALHD